jgi:pantetheine-phosphate adenylyltransferase
MSQNASGSAARRPVIAIYPGSFDPITNGHLDILERASRLTNRLIVAVLANAEKNPLFTVAERTEMLREVTAGIPNVEVGSFDGLLVDYAAKRKANAIVRGIRAISDYDNELQMAAMNRRLRPQTDTIFLMAGEAYWFISSKLVKEVISLNGSISGLVPVSVEARLRQKFQDMKG